MNFYPCATAALDVPGRAGVRGEGFVHPSHVCQIGESDQDPIGSRLNAPKCVSKPDASWRSMGAFHVSLEIHSGQDFPAQWAAHRRVQLAGGPPLAEFSQQLHLPCLAGGILVGTGLP